MKAPLGMAAFPFVAVAVSFSAAVAQTPAPLGRLVDLGGHRLHVNCTGKSSPTVVVENGLGDFSFDWILVQQRVEKFTRICTYDRAGYAWSDPGPQPRTYAQLNLELHDALNSLGEKGPYILVGHSFGGAVVRNYATTYPSEVAGVVLVDIVHEDQRIPMGKKAARVRDSAQDRPITPPHEDMSPSDSVALASINATMESMHITPQPDPIEPPYDKLPPTDQKLHLWASSQPPLIAAEYSQREWSAESMALMHATPQKGSLGSIPLFVLTRANGGYDNNLDVPAAELEAERKQSQAELVALSTNGRQIILDSGHNMHLDVPDSVATVIHEAVLASRHKHPKS